MSFKFELNKAEIDKAIKAHIATLGLATAGKHLTVDFSTTRKGGAGYSAIVTIDDTPLESTHVLDNATTAESNAARLAVIKQTGTDALGHAAENKEEIPSAPVNSGAELPVEPAANTDDNNVDLPAPTPETTGHESGKTSLFD